MVEVERRGERKAGMFYPGRPVLRSGCYGGWTLSESLALGLFSCHPCGISVERRR